MCTRSSTILIAMIFSCSIFRTTQAAADLPDSLRRDIDTATSNRTEASKAADEKLLSAFDAESALIRKQAGLKAEERQQLIEAVAIEKASFEKSGSLPLSSRMRAASISHLKALQEARRPSVAAYDKAIEFLTKSKDDAGATAMVSEKRKALEPKIVAKWDCVGVTWKGGLTYILYSDGTARIENEPQIATWTLSKDSLTIRNPDPRGPQGVWIETCVLEPTGLKMLATNQKGGKWKATRLDVTK